MQNYSTIKTAITALPSPAPTDPILITEALNLQTQTLNNQDTSIVRMLQIFLSSSTGDWAKVLNASAIGTTTVSPTVAQLSAINAVALAQSAQGGIISNVQTSDAEVAMVFDGSLNALVSAGIISTASQTAIQALRTVVSPLWMPPLTVGDIQTALAQ